MWCVIDLDGDPLGAFPDWEAAVVFAREQGGELDIVFMADYVVFPEDG